MEVWINVAFHKHFLKLLEVIETPWKIVLIPEIAIIVVIVVVWIGLILTNDEAKEYLKKEEDKR